MSFDIRVSRRLGGRTIAAECASVDGLTALFGPSGAGKTSILNMVAGLLAPDQGRIAVGETLLFDSEQGITVPARARRRGHRLHHLPLRRVSFTVV